MFVAYPAYIREKALSLRRERNLTMDEIADRLALPRSTIYHWVRDIPIPRTARQTAAQRRGTRRMQARYAREREFAYASGRHGFEAMARANPSFRDFVCLYIGEGYKRGRNTVSVGNSDPAVVEFAFRWLISLSRNRVTCSVQHHADQDPVMLCGFWGNRLGLDHDEIKLQPKSNSGRLAGRMWRCQFGVLTIRAQDTALRARLDGWMDEMKISWLDSTQSGRGEAWLSHPVWGRKNVGSNPTAPI